MSYIDELNQIATIKDEIKTILTELGVITSTTTFEEYPSIIEKLIVL